MDEFIHNLTGIVCTPFYEIQQGFHSFNIDDVQVNGEQWEDFQELAKFLSVPLTHKNKENLDKVDAVLADLIGEKIPLGINQLSFISDGENHDPITLSIKANGITYGQILKLFTAFNYRSGVSVNIENIEQVQPGVFKLITAIST